MSMPLSINPNSTAISEGGPGNNIYFGAVNGGNDSIQAAIKYGVIAIALIAAVKLIKKGR